MESLSFTFFKRSKIHRRVFDELGIWWSSFEILLNVQLITHQLFQLSFPESTNSIEKGKFCFHNCIDTYNLQISDTINKINAVSRLLDDEYLKDELWKLYKIWVHPINHKTGPIVDEMIIFFEELESHSKPEKMIRLNNLCGEMKNLIEIFSEYNTVFNLFVHQLLFPYSIGEEE